MEARACRLKLREVRAPHGATVRCLFVDTVCSCTWTAHRARSRPPGLAIRPLTPFVDTAHVVLLLELT